MQMEYLHMQMRYLICIYITTEQMDNTLHMITPQFTATHLPSFATVALAFFCY